MKSKYLNIIRKILDSIWESIEFFEKEGYSQSQIIEVLKSDHKLD